MIKLIAKANDNVLSFCTCPSTVASLPGQFDCPWCGCGWLLTCTHCRKAFVYGKIVETQGEYVDFVRADAARGGYVDAYEEGEPESDAAWLEHSLSRFEVGDDVVYFDGSYFEVGEQDLKFTGMFGTHSLTVLPHRLALKTPPALKSQLGDPSYWRSRERSIRQEDL